MFQFAPDHHAVFFGNRGACVRQRIFFIGIVVYTLRKGAKVTENNYWNEYADTLEWTVSSPPPEHTFEILPKQEDWDHSHNH